MNKDEKTKELLTRGVEEIFVKESLLKKLASGKPLRIKLGIDPTSPDLHLGHGVPLWKMRAFQDLGHMAVLIIGDFTAKVGDPSGRVEARPPLSEAEIKSNLKKYLEQVALILDIKKTEVHYNSEWLAKLDLRQTAELLSAATISQILKREDFSKRLEGDSDITMLETFYPLLQGYDSVVTKADVELGGTDQLLNLLIARKVQRHYKITEQDVITFPLLIGLDGDKKMSKSVGNTIGLLDDPRDMFGKIMSLKDDLIFNYFLLATTVPTEEIERMKEEIKSGQNPKNIKIKLAETIVEMYHGKKEADRAQKDFSETFEKKGLPEELKEVFYPKGTALVDLFIKEEMIASKTEWRRLVSEGAIKTIIDKKENAVTDDGALLEGPSVYKIGKRRFLKVSVK